MKNKKSLLGILLLVIVGVVGATIAYYTSSDVFENIFGTKVYKMEVYEMFESPDDWTPGTTTPKTVVATNKGNVPAAVRISYTEEWKDASGEVLPLTDNDNHHAAIIDFASDLNKKWITSVEDGKTYYYYKAKIAKDESTSSLIDSVTFNAALGIETEHICTTNSETHAKTCTTETEGYAGGTYKLVIKVETVQYDKYKDAWGTSVEILDEFVDYYTIVSGDLDTVGSVVKIADEEFYVIGQEDSTHVKLLAKYNLGVGNGFETPTNKQESTATGFVSGGSSPYPGSVAFSGTNYWNENVSAYPSYVYTNNKVNGTYTASIAEYVDNYVDYLNTQGVTVTGKLISKEEIESIINNGNNLTYGNFSSTASDISGKEWIYSTTYWSGSARDSSYLWLVGSSGYLHDVKYSSDRSYGVRPVIILEK